MTDKENAEMFDKIAFSYNMLRIHGCQKIQKNLVKNLKPLKRILED